MTIAFMLFIIFILQNTIITSGEKYKFKHFNWRRKSFGGKRARQAWRLCEEYCHEQGVIHEVESLNCIRMCISPTCQQILYGHDPYEPGEYDIRHNSFMGCASEEFRDGGRTLDMINTLQSLNKSNKNMEYNWQHNFDVDDEL
eukprot:gene4400-6672_t